MVDMLEVCRRTLLKYESDNTALVKKCANFEAAFWDEHYRAKKCSESYQDVWERLDTALKNFSKTSAQNWTLRYQLQESELELITLREEVKQDKLRFSAAEKKITDLEARVKGVYGDAGELMLRLDLESSDATAVEDATLGKCSLDRANVTRAGTKRKGVGESTKVRRKSQRI